MSSPSYRKAKRMYWLQVIAYSLMMGAGFLIFVSVCFRMEQLLGGI